MTRVQALALTLAFLLSEDAKAASQFSSNSAGTASGQFLKLGADARSAGMGQAVRAYAEDASAVYWNPAGLAGLQVKTATLTHAVYYQSVFYDFMAYAQPVESILGRSRERDLRPNQLGAFGIALVDVNAGPIQEVDDTGIEKEGIFTQRGVEVNTGWETWGSRASTSRPASRTAPRRAPSTPGPAGTCASSRSPTRSRRASKTWGAA
jgi:hypothetical protein